MHVVEMMIQWLKKEIRKAEVMVEEDQLGDNVIISRLRCSSTNILTNLITNFL